MSMKSELKDRIWEKKCEEFNRILPILNLHTKGLIGLCLTEEPDFHLHFADRVVGLEFSKLTNDNENAEYNEFKKLLNEYAEKFDQVKLNDSLYEDKPYRIKIWFEAGFKPHTSDGGKVKKHKEDVFEDLTNLLFPSTHYYEPQSGIIRVEPEPSGTLEKTEFQICYINAIGTIPSALLEEIIKKKEAKLQKYEALPRNKTIQEYWLAIGIGEQFDIYSAHLPESFKTRFSKIYVVKDLFSKELI